MAKLFRPTIVSYRLPNGKYRTDGGQRVTKDTPAAVREVSRSKKWYGRLPNGKPVPLAESKETSRRMLDKLRGDAQLARVGLVNPYEDHGQRPLTEHLDDYRRHLEGRNNTAEYVNKRIGRVSSILDGCRFVLWGDVNADDVMDYLAKMRQKDDGTKRHGFGLGTTNHYIGGIKGFTRWMARTDPPRAPTDPLLTLQKLNAKADIRVERRALPEDQFASFMDAAKAGPEFRYLAGRDRVVLYTLASYTGLRCSELASLTPESFILDRTPSVVVVEAAYSKHREADTIVLRPDVADLMRGYLTDKATSKALWPSSWVQAGAEMVRRDLEAAKVPWQDSRGRVYDFHALRHQFASNLAAAGVAPAVAKDLLRHSTITLTMDVYSHLEQQEQVKALEKLPGLPGSKKDDDQRRPA